MAQVPPSLPPGGVPSAAPCAPQTNGLAIASLVLGIVGLAACQCLTAIPAVIMGHIALAQIRRAAGTQTGRGMAVAGLVTGYISVGLVLLICMAYAFFILLAVGGAHHGRW